MDRISSLQRLVLNGMTPRAIVDLPDGGSCIVLNLIDGRAEFNPIDPDFEPPKEGKHSLNRQDRAVQGCRFTERPGTLLRECLSKSFNEEELRTLCYDLELDYDDLVAQGKIYKAREIVLYFERRNDVLKLLAAIESRRPDVYRDLPTQVIQAYRHSELETRSFASRERTRGSTRRIDES